MVDPISAFATATTVVKGIKTAIKLGKDVNSLVGEFDKLFEAKSIIEQEANKEKQKAKSNKSINKQALANVMRKKQLLEAERELRSTMAWAGQLDTYNALIKERARLKREQELENQRAATKKQEFIEKATYGVLITVIVCGTLYIFYLMMMYAKSLA